MERHPEPSGPWCRCKSARTNSAISRKPASHCSPWELPAFASPYAAKNCHPSATGHGQLAWSSAMVMWSPRAPCIVRMAFASTSFPWKMKFERFLSAWPLLLDMAWMLLDMAWMRRDPAAAVFCSRFCPYHPELVVKRTSHSRLCTRPPTG